jgi:hypothetical protein
MKTINECMKNILDHSVLQVTCLSAVLGLADSEPSIGKAIVQARSQPNVKSMETDLSVKASASGGK